MLNGLLNLGFWGHVAAALVLTHITIASVTIYLHRHQAHRGLDLHPAVGHFFRFWLWLTTGMVTREWVAIHRKHHAKCETPDDPHSPQVEGISEVLWRGAELYRKEAADPQTIEKYSKGTPDDWLERHLYSGHPYAGISLMLLVDLALFGAGGLTIWAIQMLWIPFWAAGVINGIGHYWGYRNYEPADASRNISPLGLLIGGEELHNNHHAFPSSARFSLKPWEFDLGWAYIRGLEVLGLARVKRVAPRPVLASAKPRVDRDTATAIAVNRLHVMASYGREVLKPILREERRQATPESRSRLRRAYRLLVRETSLVDEQGRRRISAALDFSGRLETAYVFKQQLQSLWNRSMTSQDALVQSIQEWCSEAEASGIRALQEFSKNLRRYSLQPSAL